jgi:hypothetical protein
MCPSATLSARDGVGVQTAAFDGPWRMYIHFGGDSDERGFA